MAALHFVVRRINDLPPSEFVVPLFLLMSGIAHWLDLYKRWHTH